MSLLRIFQSRRLIFQKLVNLLLTILAQFLFFYQLSLARIFQSRRLISRKLVSLLLTILVRFMTTGLFKVITSLLLLQKLKQRISFSVAIGCQEEQANSYRCFTSKQCEKWYQIPFIRLTMISLETLFTASVMDGLKQTSIKFIKNWIPPIRNSSQIDQIWP